jgi:hypothetical protein
MIGLHMVVLVQRMPCNGDDLLDHTTLLCLCILHHLQVNTGIRSISDAALASAEQHLKQQQQGVSSLPSGSSPQVSAGELAAAGGSPSVPATSLSPRDVSALVDAVPLLPSHIKSSRCNAWGHV